jgi:diguanylate cyclase (GGDEF)-like protein/PAS domain S-box-containing protein
MKNKSSEIFILLIIAVMFLTIAYLADVYKTKKEYDYFSSVLYEIQSTNLKINFFIFGEKRIYNFDSINSEMDFIKKNISILKHSNLYPEYKIQIDELEKKFNKKTKLVEKYEAYNAINISTLIYLLDVSENLRKQVGSEKTDKAIYEVFKIYLGITDEKNFFVSDDRYLSPFFEYVNSIIEKLKDINNIRKNIKNLAFEEDIEKLFEIFKNKNKTISEKLNRYFYFMIGLNLLMLFILAVLQIKIYYFRRKLYEFKIAVDKSDNSVLFLDKNGIIYYVNEFFEKNSGYTKKDLLGKHISYYLKNSLNGEYENISKFLKENKYFSKTVKTKTKNGEILYEKVFVYPIYYKDMFSNYVFVKLNITEEIKHKKEIEYIAYHDTLTGLFNRKKLLEDLNVLIGENKKFCLVFMDLSKFKFINDVFSHAMGDKILKHIAGFLKNLKIEYTYRTGGDEFALIIFDGCSEITDKIINLCREIRIDGHVFNINIHIGAVYSKNEKTSNLLKFADIALNECKKRKKQILFFDKSLYNKYMRESKISTYLPNALKNGELYVVYQPKINLYTKKVYSMEALIRWKSPVLGDVFPDEFIPVAEERNLIEYIDFYVLKQSCADFKEFKKIYPFLENVSVNLSGVELVKKDLDKKINSVFEKENCFSENIEFEVTETYLILNIEYSAEILKNLKKHGSRISIDDFGTGYSSLYYLSRLPIDTLKIDKKFVDNLEDKNNREMITIITSIAKSFNLNVIAEGVETKEQERILYELGVNKIQGYLYSKPLTKNELIEFLKKF